MANWYKHDIAAWMDGTEQLDHESYRVYHVVVQLIYLNEGPIRLNEHGISGRCNMHILKFRKVLAGLVHVGLLQFEDGKLFNVRAKSELRRLPTRRQPTLNPPATPALPPPNPGTTSAQQGGGSEGGLPRKSLESEDVASQPDLLDKTRLDKTRPEKKDAAGAATAEAQAKKEFYAECHRLFNGKGGGMGTKLLQAKGGNIWLAMAAIGAAKEAGGDPREYIGAIIRKSEPYSPIM